VLFLLCSLVCRRINLKVYRRVSIPHRTVHVRSMDFPNLVHKFHLFMVIAKPSRTGNCKHLKSKGRSVEIIGVLGISTSSPVKFPFKNVASMILFIIVFTVSLVPLQSRGGLMFRRKMIGTLNFNEKNEIVLHVGR